jgi:membrane protein
LGKSNVASAYGAAGSLVLVLLWVYYSAQILLYGAEFTQVYANRIGERIVPTPDARVTDPHKADADRIEQKSSRPPGRAA